MKSLRSTPWVHVLVITLELTFGGATLTHTQFDALGKPVGQTSGEW